jgi:hypothetical protein
VAERLLVNFFYAHPVGHAIEALHYCNGYHEADSSLEIAVALNAATPVELASLCAFPVAAYAIEHPFLEPGSAPLGALPRSWDWVVDDGRRHQTHQRDMFPGMAAYYEASDRHLSSRHRRSVAGYGGPPYLPHRQLRLRPPATADRGCSIALMPAGSSDRALYPSVAAWRLIMDGLTEALPGARIGLIGRLARDERSSTSISAAEHGELLAHPSRPVDCFDLPLAEQLAVVEACDVFVSPHTGFGLAALAVATPWLAISGGRWFEYFFNRVPFRSILPDPERYPSFSQFAPPEVHGERIPSMSDDRIREDLDRIVAAAVELTSGTLDYEQALREYFRDLLAVHRGDASAIWSIDDVHVPYVA